MLKIINSILSWGPGHPPSSQQMEMDMKYVLTGIFSGIQHYTVSTFFYPHLLGNLARTPEQMTEDFFFLIRNINERGKVFFGDEQYMSRGLGIDILEGNDLVIFIHYLRRNVLIYDFTEYALCRIHSSLRLNY